VETVQKIGSRRRAFDQVWVVNKFAGLFEADLIFHMDDFAMQEARAAAGNVAIGNMLNEMRRTTTPIITSRRYEHYPTSREFPLEEVVKKFGFAYFNGTVAYAIAYAALRHEEIREIDLFGCDFAWQNTPAKVEKGRACCEYWLGRCHQLGMRIGVLSYSSLFDGGTPQFYGYDSRDVVINPDRSISFKNKPLPSVEEIEARYDHTVEQKLRSA
jgi:hypothetical protein